MVLDHPTCFCTIGVPKMAPKLNRVGAKDTKTPRPDQLLDYGQMLYNKAFKYASDSGAIQETDPAFIPPKKYTPDVFNASLLLTILATDCPFVP